MAWIESHQELGRHPKARRMARQLNISRPAVVGHLHYLWWWAMDFAQDGDVTEFDGEEIAEAALWDGEPMAFLTALTDCGFVDMVCSADGEAYLLHDWESYAGKLVAHRKANANKQKAWRERQKSDVTEPQPKPISNVTVMSPLPLPLRSGATVPNPTQQYQEKTPPTEGAAQKTVLPVKSIEPVEETAAVSDSSDLPEDNRANSQPKPKRTMFIRPSEPECLEYFILKSHPEHSERFWNYWESVGWKRSGKLMVDWQAAARQWIAEEKTRGASSGSNNLVIRTNKPGGMTIEDRKNETLAALRAG